MTRHAGFAAVATVTEKLVNDVIASYCRGMLGPFFFPLPTTITVGFATVTFSGLMEMLPPTVELHANPGNLVTVHFVFRSTLRAQFAGQPMQTWTVQWGEDVTTGIIAAPQNGRIVLGINTSQVVFQPLTVQVLNGPALPGPVLNALQSPALAAAATNFVQGLPPITASPPLLSSQINYTQPLNLPWIIDPSWFTINLNASDIALKTLEKALSVGVDFTGFTTGNANDLIDLTAVKGSGSIYKQHFTQMTDPSIAPYLSGYSEPKGGQIAAAINMSFISAVVANQISPQISETPISVSPNPDVNLMSISASYSMFNIPLDGIQDGLAIGFHVYVAEGPEFGADGRLLLQIYLREADGTTDFVYNFPDQWRIYIAKVEVDLPWWADFAIAMLTIYFGVAIPFIAPLVTVMGVALLDGVVPGLLASVESQAQNSLQSSANAVGFPTPWLAPLPGLTTPNWYGSIKYVSVTPVSLDLAINEIPSEDVNAQPGGTISPDSFPASNKNPISVKLKLRDDLERLGGDNLILSWSVRRADTNQIVATGVKAYNDPAGNGILAPHHTPELYYVDAFAVTCTASLTLGNQIGDIWTGTKTILISDNIDRHHKYIEWGPHPVYFKNAGTGNVWWSHIRKSRIHRTAVSARCKMLRQTASEHKLTHLEEDEYPFTTITYADTLPFPWNQLNAHRKPLCEYCFFGGPEKTVPFPEEDWF